MSLKQWEIKLKPRIKLNNNICIKWFIQKKSPSSITTFMSQHCVSCHKSLLFILIVIVLFQFFSQEPSEKVLREKKNVKKKKKKGKVKSKYVQPTNAKDTTPETLENQHEKQNLPCESDGIITVTASHLANALSGGGDDKTTSFDETGDCREEKISLASCSTNNEGSHNETSHEQSSHKTPTSDSQACTLKNVGAYTSSVSHEKVSEHQVAGYAISHRVHEHGVYNTCDPKEGSESSQVEEHFKLQSESGEKVGSFAKISGKRNARKYKKYGLGRRSNF